MPAETVRRRVFTLARMPYDGKVTKADGRGRWWDGLDPQDLYEQRHQSTYVAGTGTSGQWRWGGGVVPPDQAYADRFYNRTVDLIDRYQPDLLYFDDTALPLWPVSDAGLKIAARFYNQSVNNHGGTLEIHFADQVPPGAGGWGWGPREHGADTLVRPCALGGWRLTHEGRWLMADTPMPHA